MISAPQTHIADGVAAVLDAFLEIWSIHPVPNLAQMDGSSEKEHVLIKLRQVAFQILPLRLKYF